MQTLRAPSAMLCMNQKTLSVLRVLSGIGGIGVSSLQFLRVLGGLGVRFQESHT